MLFGLNVPEDTQGWVIDNFEWAIKHQLLRADTPLFGLDKATFPIPKGSHDVVVPALVERIQELLGIADQKIDTRPLDQIPAEYRYDPNAMGDVGGTWQQVDGAAVITYDPSQMDRPVALISTLVHEVMHHRLHMTPCDMPGGPEAEELCTDLHCITAGFGLAQMAGAEQAGWQGYLRQETRAFALAVFLKLVDAGSAVATLPTRSSKMVSKARKLLRGWEDDIADLRQALRT